MPPFCAAALYAFATMRPNPIAPHAFPRPTVEEELRWEPEVDDTDISVKITNGVVTLTNAQLDADSISIEAQDGELTLRGQVHSWAEREQACGTAWSAPGVTHVVNEINVVS